MLNQGALDSTPVDRVFHALAEPSRRLLVERLSRGPASVSELARPLEITLAAVVQHVQVLEECGVIRSEKLGRVRTCRIDPAGLALVERWVEERRSQWERRFDRLAEVLAAGERPGSTAATRRAPAGAPSRDRGRKKR